MFVNLSKIHLYATCISKETVHIPKTCVIQVMHIHMCMYMYTLNVLAWTYLQHWHWLCLSCKCSKMVARLKIINKLDTNNLCIRTWHTNCSCKSDVHANHSGWRSILEYMSHTDHIRASVLLVHTQNTSMRPMCSIIFMCVHTVVHRCIHRCMHKHLHTLMHTVW